MNWGVDELVCQRVIVIVIVKNVATLIASSVSD